ncbi:MAG: GNAT family N-acetyltransferase, partial [Verrucomicrobia bacterium]|nr:GNAT family N-acetyltransferase [Cytophagales bacterium]
LMSYSFEHCLLFGKVLLSENKDGCVMLLYPSLKKTTFSTLLLDIKFVFHIGLFHAIKAMNREKEIKRYHPTSPFCHLWFIGVLPSQQGKGIGNRLLNEVMASESLPIYLETSVKNNISWYERKGFHSFQELNFPQSKDKTYTLTLMKK